MTPFPHRYHVQLAGGPEPHGQLSAPGLPPLLTSPPIEFGGPGDAWSPEHLLLAAVESCYLFTFRAVARAARLDFERLDINAAGTVNREGGVTRFTDIVLTVGVTVPAGAEQRHVLQTLDRAAKNCLVTASLATRVRVELEVHIGRGAGGIEHEHALPRSAAV